MVQAFFQKRGAVLYVKIESSIFRKRMESLDHKQNCCAAYNNYNLIMSYTVFHDTCHALKRVFRPIHSYFYNDSYCERTDSFDHEKMLRSVYAQFRGPSYIEVFYGTTPRLDSLTHTLSCI